MLMHSAWWVLMPIEYSGRLFHIRIHIIDLIHLLLLDLEFAYISNIVNIVFKVGHVFCASLVASSG